MPISIRCGACDKQLNIDDRFAGKKIKCPQCQAVLSVPGEEEEERPAPRRRDDVDRPSPRRRDDDDRPRKRDGDEVTHRPKSVPAPPRDEYEDDRPSRKSSRD